MGYFPWHRAGSEAAGLNCPFNSINTTPDGVHEHPADKVHRPWGTHRHLRRPHGGLFAKFGKIEEVNNPTSKAGIATGDIVLQVTLMRQAFVEIPNVLMCRERRMLVVVEGRKPYCWLCGASGHMSKACPAKKPQPPPYPTTATTTTAAAVVVAVTSTEKSPDSDWKKVKERKSAKAPSPQERDVQSPGKKQERPKAVLEQPKKVQRSTGKQEKLSQKPEKEVQQQKHPKQPQINRKSNLSQRQRWRWMECLHLVPLL